MGNAAREILASAVAGMRRGFRDLAVTDLAYRAISFALLSPLVALLLQLAMARGGGGAYADADIARFFLTTRAGLFGLLAASTLTVAIAALETAALLATGFARAGGLRLSPARALAFSAANAGRILALAGHIILRVVIVLVPLAAAAGLVYLGLLREHDINFYLADKPPQFWIAAVLVGAIGAVGAWLALRALACWVLALPLLLFERVPPRRALRESAARTRGHRRVVLAVLAAWVVVALASHGLGAALVQVVGRAIAPLMVTRVGLLLTFVTLLIALGGVLAIAIAVVNAVLWALVVLGIYRRVGSPPAGAADALLRAAGAVGEADAPPPFRASGRARAAVAAIAVVGAAGLALLAFLATRGTRDVAVIAHRGSCTVAPENSLAAFRLAIEEGADYVELDVQESADGVVVVAHDLDLMKVGGSPLKVFETSAEELRRVPIGRRADPLYADERIPTLAEVLALCKGKVKLVIELKSYGHDDRLEERTAELVEAAGMEDDCIYMSLDHAMVARMKQLRPNWRVGILVAKAIGDLRKIEADFVAVEARMATPRFVRREHRAGRQVYVWTVNDPGWMFATMSRGVDGLITDVPAIARQAVARRQQMSDAQRFLAALLLRLGARTEALVAEDALRP